eukprot:1121409-Ditylum_brightwellii.AAC.1
MSDSKVEAKTNAAGSDLETSNSNQDSKEDTLGSFMAGSGTVTITPVPRSVPPIVGGGGGRGNGSGGGAGRAGGGAGGSPSSGAVPSAATGHIFALTPLQVNLGAFIDYLTSTRIKLFQLVTEPLSIVFDTTSLKDRAKKSGWELTGGNVTTIPDSNDMACNLITEYSRLSPEDIEAQVTLFVGRQTRQAQNLVRLYHCLKNSLTETAKLKILAETLEYIVNGHPSGELLLKLLIKKAVMDTQATASHLCENLTNLDNYISTINSNINLFNHHV